MPVSRISGIVLSFKYHFDLSLRRNTPSTMCKDLQQMRSLKGVSVKMSGPAQFRNRGGLVLLIIIKRSISLKTFPLIYFGQ